MADKYDYIRDIRDDAAKQQIKEEYVERLISQGKSPVGSIGKLSPEAWSNIPKDSLDEMALAFDKTPPGPEKDQALADFYDAVAYALKTNPQTFQKIVNTNGEAAVNRILSEHALINPGSATNVRDLIAAAKVPPSAPRAVPTVGPARHPATGAPTELQPVSTEQQFLHNASEADIMNIAAVSGGWDGYTGAKPEDVMYIYQHRSDLPSIKMAAEGALRRAGHIA